MAGDTSAWLLSVSAALAGRTHDRVAFTRTGWEQRLDDSTVIADPAYQGTRALTPKETKGGELSSRDKVGNQTISSIRSAIERCIAHLKNWKILATGYRGRLAELGKFIKITTSLEFYRPGWRP